MSPKKRPPKKASKSSSASRGRSTSTKKASPKKKTAKPKTATKRAPAKKSAKTTKKTAAKKAAVKKTAAKKKAAPKKVAKKATAKKVAKKSPAKKVTAKKKAAPKKKAVTKKATAKKAVAKKASSKKASSQKVETRTSRGLTKAKSSTADYEKFRYILLTLRARLLGDVNMMSQEALGPEGSMDNHAPLHPAEVGTHSFEQEFTLNRLSSEGDRLEQIDSALAKLADGTYGACEECGGRIPKPRLEVIPDTPFCVKCASKLES